MGVSGAVSSRLLEAWVPPTYISSFRAVRRITRLFSMSLHKEGPQPNRFFHQTKPRAAQAQPLTPGGVGAELRGLRSTFCNEKVAAASMRKLTLYRPATASSDLA